MTTLSPTFAPNKRISHDQCCPPDNGFCPDNDGHTFPIPLLDLSESGAARPSIDGKIGKYGDDLGDNPVVDGWVGAEYMAFTELPMFNGGKNGADGSPLAYSGRIGTAYIAYDCSSEVVCVSAHLHSEFLKTNPQTGIQMKDEESWIRFGPDGAMKLKESNSKEFSYVGMPDSSSTTIGYEGCWSIKSFDSLAMQSITNNVVEVHFSLHEGQTTSTGKPASDGDYICLRPQCEWEVPERPFSRGLRGAAKY